MNPDSVSNAVAGPSTLPDSILPYLPPPGPHAHLHPPALAVFADTPYLPGPSHPSPYFSSTEDLLAKFRLLSAYDKYVRPFVDSSEHDSSIDKGKGKERDLSPSPEPTTALGNDLDDDENDKRKKKNSYRHLIKGIPGKHSLKKDEFLTTIMQVPPKQRISIITFDPKTQADAFSVSLDGLKGWNIAALITESPQAREDRKKRKEMKRLAKAQAMHHASQPPQTTSTPTVSSHITTPLPVHPVPVAMPPRSATPKAVVAHPGSRPPIAVPHVKTESPQPTPSSDPAIQRGKKRDHESSVFVPSSQHQKTTAIVGAKAGINGVRPRPLKKQRMDLQGQGRDMSIHQQPTPQGV